MRILVLACLMVSLLLSPVVVKAESGYTWLVPDDFATIQEAIDDTDVAAGDVILVGPGDHAGAFVTKSVTIQGLDGAVISSGPVHGSGMIQGFRLMAGSGGTTISHLTFTTDLSIMNGAAVDDVTVTHCTFENSVQAISNWCGSGWVITHNEIIDLRTRNGGGIGILVGDYAGGIVEGNVVSHNKIHGTLYVATGDGGGYAGSGIVLFADFRWGRGGAEAITANRIVHNKVGLVSDTPESVGVVAIELTDTRDGESLEPVIFANAVGFNDLRGTVVQIALTPTNLDAVNAISRNLGDNRGHGLHPSLFGPGG